MATRKSVKDPDKVVLDQMKEGKKLSIVFDKIIEDLNYNASPSSKLSKSALEYLELRKSEVLRVEDEAPKLHKVVIKCGGLRLTLGLMAKDEDEAKEKGIKEWKKLHPHVPLVKGEHRIRVEQVDYDEEF